MFFRRKLEWPALQPNEHDQRFADFSQEFLLSGDTIKNRSTLSAFVFRRDGWDMAPGDLFVSSINVDVSGLIVTLWLDAPPPSAGIAYCVTIIINPTTQGRRIVTTVNIDVDPWTGLVGNPPPWPAEIAINATVGVFTNAEIPPAALVAAETFIFADADVPPDVVSDAEAFISTDADVI